MKRTRKVRGHRRKWRDIAKWVDHCQKIDAEHFERLQRDYAKVWVHPWSGIAVTNSDIAEPRRKTRRLIVEGLLKIYFSWKVQLDELNQPYYLKIWLFDPYLSKSRVVCATGEMLNHYDQAFYKPDIRKTLNTQHFGGLSESMTKLSWEHHWDEFRFFDDDIGEPEDFASLQEYEENKRDFERLMKMPTTRRSTIEIGNRKITAYSRKVGNVWIGGV